MKKRAPVTSVALAAALACASSAPLEGPQRGPRVVFSPYHLDALDERDVPHRLPRFGLHLPPYWQPTTSDVSTCEGLLSAAAGLRPIRHELSAFGMQFAGVTDDDQRVLLVLGFSPEWMARADIDYQAEPVQVLGGGTWFFSAWCLPDGTLRDARVNALK
jgi:hypothetical protein